MASIHELYELYRSSNKQNTAILEFIKNTANEKFVKEANDKGKTVLDLAYDNDDYPLVSLLLESNAYADIPKAHKLYMLYKSSEYENADILDFLQDPINKQSIAEVNETGETVLHLACYDDEWEVAYLLIELGLDVTKRDHNNCTALSNCVLCQYQEMNIPLIQLLIARGGDINQIDERGDSQLHYAVLSGDHRKIAILLSLGADIDQMNKMSETPLNKAFMINIPNKNLIIRLIFKQSDIISQDFSANNGQGITNIIPPPGLTDGVVVVGSTVWDPALVPVTRATPGFENAITNAEEFRQAAEADEKRLNELLKLGITDTRRYNYKAIEIITRNKKDPVMQALHAVAEHFAGITESRVASLKNKTAHLLAKQCIFSKFNDRIKLEKVIAVYPQDVQDLIEKEIHAMAVAKSTRNQ